MAQVSVQTFIADRPPVNNEATNKVWSWRNNNNNNKKKQQLRRLTDHHDFCTERKKERKKIQNFQTTTFAPRPLTWTEIIL